MGARKDILKKLKPRLRYVLYAAGLGLLALFLYVKAVSPPAKDEPPRPQAPAGLRANGPLAKAPGSPARATSRAPSILRTDLLENQALSQGENFPAVSRSIFQPLRPPEPALSSKKAGAQKEAPPVEPVLPKIKAKLVGIMGRKADTPQGGLVQCAVLSIEGEVVVVKKGDIILDKYEVLEVTEETVDILVKETGQVEKLSLEKSAP